MLKVAVMGDYDSIYGFQALGLDIYPVDERRKQYLKSWQMETIR